MNVWVMVVLNCIFTGPGKASCDSKVQYKTYKTKELCETEAPYYDFIVSNTQNKTAYTKRVTSPWVCIKAEETTQIIERYKLEKIK